jgi:mono/diheme cytochrome c family protein
MRGGKFLLSIGALALAACEAEPLDVRRHIPEADAARGRDLVRASACGACHEIPGIRAARGIVGPSLRGFARRATIGGILANRPGNLMAWVENAPRIAPRTAMPRFDFDAESSADIAAFLYTLR